MNTNRLKGSVNLKRMNAAHVVVVGVGGAMGVMNDLTRCSIGKITAIDFDRVDASNLCTQGYTLKDVGKLKILALGERLKTINPKIEYIPINRNFLTMTEDEIEEIMADADILLFMTDDFYAQARGNLVALKFRIPALFAIVYEKARCAEITFTISGKTPACHRCATSPRYTAYENGYVNDVTSAGSNVTQTGYLNACIGMLCLAILNMEDPSCEFGLWLKNEEILKRNLVQLRMSPLYGDDQKEQTIFDKTFKGIERVFTFDSVWQLIEPERPPKYSSCPDCGGYGCFQSIYGQNDTFPRIRK
jgi:molybdopterin/thiamine biosynthesis adenylyltransferase